MMKQHAALIFCAILFCTACKKQAVKLSGNANDIFWITNNGADMPVWVKGNTASRVIILIVHGGPGGGSYNFTDYQTARLQEKYGVAFWDQRNSGSASGNSNIGKLTLSQMANDLNAVVKVIKYRYGNPSIFLYAHSFGGLLAAAYLETGTNQNDLKGWMEIDG